MYLIKIELKKIIQYIENIKVNIMFTFISIGIELSIYYMFFYDNTDSKLWTNTIVYVIFSSSMYNLITINRVPEFAEEIKNGKIIKNFIRPINIFDQFILQEIGNSMIEVVQSLPVIGLGIIMSFLLIGNINNILFFIISLLLSIVLSTLIANTIFSFTFLTLDYSGIKAILQGISSLLSGALIPLILWPERLVAILKYSPFAVLIDGPIEIILNIEKPQNIIIFQILWCIVFYSVGRFLFKKLPQYCDYVGG